MNISQYQSNSQDWSDQDWEKLLAELIASGLVSHKEVTSLVLGHLNPPQIGTSIASKENFKNQFPPRKCWEAVRKWHFNQMGRCADCGTRFELQADHIIPKQQLGNNADKLENLTFRCRRCNVIKRPSFNVLKLTKVIRETPVIKIIKGKNIHGHTAPFPEAIPKLLFSLIPEEETIIDPFTGSMTTGRAAIRKNRKSINIELHKEYCDLALDLLKKQMNEVKQMRLFD